MIKNRLRYNKINTFIQDLNIREQQYIIKKLQKKVIENQVNQVNFTINGKKIVNS